MASHVVVIDSTARRATVKTTPNKPLTEVLDEACVKLGANPSQYGLKHNNKPVDLSRSIRLSGLSSGAKLELVQLSKSAGVVSVALQLPESEAQGIPNARLTDKFPSSTTLWQLLRRFEAGVAGGAATRNLTARGAPTTHAGTTGAGRLYYEQPVISIMGRELSTFTDLQKNLAQLGYNSGSILLRLSFSRSETPLEEAIQQIAGYFESIEPAPQTSQPEEKSQPIETTNPSQTEPPQGLAPDAPTQQTDQAVSEATTSAPASTNTDQSANALITSTTPSQKIGDRTVEVFRPPSSSTPSAALRTHNESDYTPTVEHAQVHQRMLSQAGRNVRLQTEAEIAAQSQADAEKLAAISEVVVKVQFPDESTVSAKFTQIDSGASLYGFVRECLEQQWQNEPFVLRLRGVRGQAGLIPDDENKKLIRDIQLRGQVFVVCGWDDATSADARGAKSVLKAALKAQAQEIKVAEIVATEQADDPGIKIKSAAKAEPDVAEGDEKGKGKGLPKWLKLGKK